MFNKILWKPPRLGVIILLAVGLLLAACQASQPSTTAGPAASPTPAPTPGRADDTLRLLYWQAPDTLNPHLTGAQKNWDPSRITYEPLASFDKSGTLIPFLAAEIPSLDNGGVAPDGKSVTWKLKQGVKWFDGEPFTAADVKFTYDFISDPEVKSPSASAYTEVADVEVIDDYTVRVNFKDVNPTWALPFVGIQGLILPQHKFADFKGAQAAQAPANTLPVGTGPYRVVEPGIKPQEVLFFGNELFPTNKIVYEPNPNFRDKDKLYFSRIELRGGSSVNEAARSVFQFGDVDFAWNLAGADRLEELAGRGQGQVISVFGPLVERILLNQTDPRKQTAEGEFSTVNFKHPFFQDKKVRQAFAYAIDREAIARLYGPTGRPTSNILVAPEIYASPNTSDQFDLKKAAALLDEAGWVDTNNNGIRDKDGTEMKVVYQTTANNAIRQETQRIVQAALTSIGVDVELRAVPPNVFGTSLYQFLADMQAFFDGNSTPDPGPFMRYFTCDQIPTKKTNWTGENVERWCSSEYDALYQASTRAVDPEERRRLFIQMNDLLVNEVISIPLVNRAQVSGISNRLTGLDPTPWDSSLWNIKDWKFNQ